MPLPAASGQKRLSRNPAMSEVTTTNPNVAAVKASGDHWANCRNVRA